VGKGEVVWTHQKSRGAKRGRQGSTPRGKKRLSITWCIDEGNNDPVLRRQRGTGIKNTKRKVCFQVGGPKVRGRQSGGRGHKRDRHGSILSRGTG